MVGTGRIELPTSSVSRKRSPTELRACKTPSNSPRRVLLWKPKIIIRDCGWSEHSALRGARVSIHLSSARDRIYYQFLTRLSTESVDRRRIILEPHQSSVKVLKAREDRADRRCANERCREPRMKHGRIVQDGQCRP